MSRQLGQITVALVIALAALALLAGWTYLQWQYPFLYREAVYRYALEQGLDPMLVAAVIRVESRYRPHAVSPKGALGLMQVMPETGQWIASQLGVSDFSPEMLYDPFLNIRFGTWYLGQLRDEFRGDMVLALAAYNGGRTRVREWTREAGWIPGEGSFPPHLIPYGETREYVGRVTRDQALYQKLYRSGGEAAPNTAP